MTLPPRSSGASIRPPAVAGTFYPDEPHALRDVVDSLLADAPVVAAPVSPKAIIAPHAGFMYSGAIAASAYVRWQADRGQISRIVLLGPAHRVAVRSLALSSAVHWETPLGSVAIDRTACDALTGLDGVVVDDRAHADEHSLEVHLPFLQRLLPSFNLVPVLVGHASAELVADALETCWGDEHTRIVISTDLSHYHDYDTALALDRRTAATIVSGSATLAPTDACGAYPVNGMIEAARRHRLGLELVDLRNSGDTAGSRDRVVGYGAFTVGSAT
jgi:AmmeMemoRadiSam system protein B